MDNTPESHLPPPAPVEESGEQRMARLIFEAVSAQFQAQFDGLRDDISSAATEIQHLSALNGQLSTSLAAAQARLDRELVDAPPRTSRVPAPRVNPPTPFAGDDKKLADCFIRQVATAAKFTAFENEGQQISWAESFLTGQAHDWSSVITSSTSDPRRLYWDQWVTAFRSVFCTRDAAHEALARIQVLSQGSRTISTYVTEFQELRGRLDIGDQSGAWIEKRFWEGLNVDSMEALANTDYKSVEEAQEILLSRETRLVSLAARRAAVRNLGARHQPAPSAPRAPAAPPQVPPVCSSVPPPAVAALPRPPLDPNGMDVDAGRRACKPIKCYGCHQEGHLIGQCPSLLASIQAAVTEAVHIGRTPAPAAPGPGFV